MSRIAAAILALLYGLVILCGGHPLDGDHSLMTAVVFAGIGAVEPGAITVTIQKFIEISGLSNTTVYAMLNRAELEAVTIGRRRLIILASYWRLLDRKRGTPAEKPLARPPTRIRERKEGGSAVAG